MGRCPDTRRCYEGHRGRKFQGLSQCWIEHVTALTFQARCADPGIDVMGISNCFLTEVKTCSTGRNSYALCFKASQKSTVQEVRGPMQKPISASQLKRYVINLPSEHLYLHSTLINISVALSPHLRNFCSKQQLTGPNQ